MTRQQKILIAVGAAVVVLYTAALGNQGRSGEGDARSPGGFVQWLGGRFGGSPQVDPADLSAACLTAANRLAFKGSCTVRVAARDGGMRRVTLRPQQPVAVSARAPRGEDSVSDDVPPGEKADVAVDERGGDVTVQCGVSEECVVLLGGED